MNKKVIIRKKPEKELDYGSYQPIYGDIYHLLRYSTKTPDQIRFVTYFERPRFAGVNGNPIFFSDNQQFRVAIDYTIIYPKVYVKKSVPLDMVRDIQLCYIQ